MISTHIICGDGAYVKVFLVGFSGGLELEKAADGWSRSSRGRRPRLMRGAFYWTAGGFVHIPGPYWAPGPLHRFMPFDLKPLLNIPGDRLSLPLHPHCER